MLLLRSANRFDLVGRFDRGRGLLSEKVVRGNEAQRLPTAGYYSHFGDDLVALYADDGTVWLRIGDEEIRADAVNADWSPEHSIRRLRLVHDGEVVREVSYRLPMTNSSRRSTSGEAQDGVVDTTAFVEAEDFDFGLFIANVLNDPERQRVLVEEIKRDPAEEPATPSLASWKLWLLRLLMRRGDRESEPSETRESLAQR